MPRPKLPRRTNCKPVCKCYLPEIGSSKEGVLLGRDEYQAIKLADVDGLDQKTACLKMNVSQPTFGRILSQARRKISGAIVRGEMIKIV